MVETAFEWPLLRGELLVNVPLARYTSLRVGGVADYLFLPKDSDDLLYFLKHFPKTIPLLWLGLGSNTLIRDGGYRGAVIITQGILNQLTALDEQTIYAGAGVASAQLARFAARLGASSFAFLAGIPGTVGGALAMNAGCHTGETWRVVTAVEMVTREGERVKRAPLDFKIGYREVVGPAVEWFLGAYFQYTAGDKAEALETIRRLLERRSNTQPTGLFNCGSVFRNPPHHYAGALIEACGLKGYRVGGAMVSEKHANFIINHDHATAYDIETLIETVQSMVLQKTGVSLVREVCIIGEKLA